MGNYPTSWGITLITYIGNGEFSHWCVNDNDVTVCTKVIYEVHQK